MIGYLRGIVREVDTEGCIIDVNGVGYAVYCSKRTLTDLEPKLAHDAGEVVLHTRLIHREDTLDLYGFLHKEEKHLFNLLITVSGVGPKQAIKILGTSKVPDISARSYTRTAPFSCSCQVSGRKNPSRLSLSSRRS